MFAFPSLYLLNEIIDQPVNVHEGVGGLLVAKVLVIALAALVVEADNPPAGLHINEAVFESMARRRDRIRHPPDHHFKAGAIVGNIPEAGNQLGFHVGDYANGAGCCQCCQRAAKEKPKISTYAPAGSLTKPTFLNLSVLSVRFRGHVVEKKAAQCFAVVMAFGFVM